MNPVVAVAIAALSAVTPGKAKPEIRGLLASSAGERCCAVETAE
jgi:hypothetical protein